MTTGELVFSIGVLALGGALAVVTVLFERVAAGITSVTTDRRPVDFERVHYGAEYSQHINRTGGASQ